MGSDGARAVDRACLWLSRRDPTLDQPPLSGPARADVAIVGGGFTGLWTALALRRLEPTLDIVLVEANHCGHGASGRNAGIVGETIDHSHALAVAHFGVEEAGRLARLGRRNLAELAAELATRGIDAELEVTGQLMVALDERAVGDLAAACDLAHRLGSTDWRVLSATETRAELSSPLYRGALLVPGNALVDPMRLVEGLRREALRLGVRIHERTPVERFETGPGAVRLTVPLGSLAADRLILATNAYSHRLWPRLARWFLPLYDYVVASAPLAPEQLERLGWQHRRGITDTRNFFNYYRLTRDDRIVFGTSEALFTGGDVSGRADRSDRHTAELAAALARLFPQLGTLALPFAWGGAIAGTTRFTPFFGATAGGRVLYGLGYTGHGIASSRLAGQILAELALDRPSELSDLALVRRKPFPYPPEPLRGWAVAAVSRALRRVDAGSRPGILLRFLDRLGRGLSS